MQGLHLTADLHGCPTERSVLTEASALRDLCLLAARKAQLQPVAEVFHRFEPASSTARGTPGAMPAAAGITGVVLLAESHLAVHTWPEIGAVTIDVYVCNFGADNSHKAHAAMQHLIDAFAPQHVARRELRRGAVALVAQAS